MRRNQDVDKVRKQRGKSFAKTSMKCYLTSSVSCIRTPTGLQGLAWRLSRGCTKALSHPEAPCVNTKRVTVCTLAFPLSSVFVWLGRVLFISRDPPHREETMLSVESVSYRSVSLSLVCLSGCVCLHWHSIPISLCKLSNTSIFFFISQCHSLILAALSH